MINPATQPQNELNEFTDAVKRGNGYFNVLLRNGEIVRPEFFPAEDEHCEDCFMTDDKCWNPDGTSVTRRDYDMMEIVRHEQ